MIDGIMQLTELYELRNYMIHGILQLKELHDWQNYMIEEIKYNMLVKLDQVVVAKF